MNNVLRCAAILVTAITLAACSSSDGGNEGFVLFRPKSNTTLPVDSLDARKLGYVTTWIKDLSSKRKHQMQHVVMLADVLVTVQGPNNIVSAVAVRDGGLLWRRSAGTAFEALYRPVRRDDRVLVNSSTRLYQLDVETGDLKYATNLQYAVSSAPGIANDVGWFGSVNGMLYAHDLDSGLIRYEYRLPGEILTSPIIAGQFVFAADATGIYKALEAASGDLIWDGRSFAPILAQPSVGTAIYVPSTDQTLYALDRGTGNDRWKFRTRQALRKEATPIGRYVFLPLTEGGLVALGALDGEEMWRVSDAKQAIIVTTDRVLLNTGNALRWVELETGKTIEEVPTMPLRTVFSGPDDSLILVTEKGYMQRIDPVK